MDLEGAMRCSHAICARLNIQALTAEQRRSAIVVVFRANARICRLLDHKHRHTATHSTMAYSAETNKHAHYPEDRARVKLRSARCVEACRCSEVQRKYDKDDKCLLIDTHFAAAHIHVNTPHFIARKFTNSMTTERNEENYGYSHHTSVCRRTV